MAEPVLKRGSNDAAVQDLQEALKALGHDPGPVDGVFGAQTESAVKAFQQAREIPIMGWWAWCSDEEIQDNPTLISRAFRTKRPRAKKTQTDRLDQVATPRRDVTCH
jgi:peptidoglycan hydrolase-like protein with peptidoglycan-binding domain